MRAILAVSVLLTVAVAWAVAAAPEAPKRATPVASAPVENVESELGWQPAAVEEPPALIEVSAGDGKWAAIEADALPASWVPLDLVVADGETGGRREARQAIAAAESRSGGEVVWRSSTHVRRGDPVEVVAKVVPLAGHVADDDGAYRASGHVSGRADRVRVLAPLRREADVVLRVMDATGRPARGARIQSVTLAGGEPRLSHESPFQEFIYDACSDPGPVIACTSESADNMGRMRIRGIPHLLEERFWITAGTEDHENYTELRLGPLGSVHVQELRLPEAPTWVWPAGYCISVGGGCGGVRRSLKAGGRFVPARLEVVVYRRDGVVAAGVPVDLGSHPGLTDDAGRAVFERIRPGEYALVVRDPDFVWSKATVELRDGDSRVVELVEPTGWTARATLLDSVGRRVPFARVHVSSHAPVAYVRVEDGIQDLAFYTDENGDIELPRLHHAPVRLRFDYGSRQESVTIEESVPFATVQLPPP